MTPLKRSIPLEQFKERELEILNLMALGLSNQEIADQLFITKETVRWYNKRIYSLLNTNRRTEAIAVARIKGLIGKAAPSSEADMPTLPSTTGPFIGRDSDIDQLKGLLAKPETRLVSIIAVGGMGKSRLSLELAHQIKSDYQHGVAFIDLTPVRNPDEVVNFTLSTLGIPPSDRPEETLFNYCREKELLLIFDNFEQVLAGASLLSNILQAAPKVKIIVTSRERLNLRVEVAYYLQPITEKGAELFSEILIMIRPDLIISNEDQTHIQNIVNYVGGLPLGLILAATWIDTLSISEISDEIETRLDFLSSELADMPERQRSIQAVIEPTWKRLSEEEQRAFMWISVFRGGFTRKTFEALTGSSIRIIQALMSRSLIVRGYGQRFDMHPLIRKYAREKLEQSQMLSQARNAHLRTFLDYVETQNRLRNDGQHYLESLNALGLEQENFRAALDWSLSGSGHQIEDGIALTLALNNFWENRSQLQEAVHYLELARDLQPNATLYLQLGFCQHRMGQIEKAEDNVLKSISLASQSQSLDVLANSHRMLAILYRAYKPNQEIQSLLEKALEYAEASEKPYILALCHSSIGGFFSVTGADSALILWHYQKELEIWQKLGNLQGISRTFYNMALEYYRQGETQRARDLCEQSLNLKRQIGDKAGFARRITQLAVWDIVDEEFERASRYLDEGLVINQELGEQYRLKETLFIQGSLFLIKGEYERSEKALKESLQIAMLLRTMMDVESCYASLGLLSLLRGETSSALSYILQGIEAIRSINRDPWASMTAYANFLWYQGDHEACIPVVAVLYLELEQNVRGHPINNKFFLHPLFARVRQQIGEQVWNQALESVSGITINQMSQELVDQHKTE